MKVAIAFIGTRKYLSFFSEFYASCMELLLINCDRRFLVFTDCHAEWPLNCTVYPVEHQPWPLMTLKRFEILLKAEHEISHADWFIYLDADMIVTDKLTEADLFSPTHPLFGVQHPAYYGTSAGTFESNPRSRAYVPANAARNIYWQGCLWGGRPAHVIPMIKTLSRRVQDDLAEDVIAVWWDESHLNKFFIDNKDLVNTLDPGFAFPACNPALPFERKIVHLEKNDSEYWFA
jgi:Glycosyltransferase family 6